MKKRYSDVALLSLWVGLFCVIFDFIENGMHVYFQNICPEITILSLMRSIYEMEFLNKLRIV